MNLKKKRIQMSIWRPSGSHEILGPREEIKQRSPHRKRPNVNHSTIRNNKLNNFELRLGIRRSSPWEAQLFRMLPFVGLKPHDADHALIHFLIENPVRFIALHRLPPETDVSIELFLHDITRIARADSPIFPLI